MKFGFLLLLAIILGGAAGFSDAMKVQNEKIKLLTERVDTLQRILGDHRQDIVIIERKLNEKPK